MRNGPTHDVPPNSSLLRELAHAIEDTLTLPRDAAEKHELEYLRVSRDRARLVSEVCREIRRDPDIERDERDVMALVVRLRLDTRPMPGGWR
jgi:hypothetical protein